MAGAVGFTYAAVLGLALVYLGEHYLADLVAGAALTETIRAAAPRLRGPPGRCPAPGPAATARRSA